MKFRTALFALPISLFLTTKPVFAYDGQIVGQIDIIQGASNANGGFPFVLSLKGTPALCGNVNTTAYLLSTDINFRVNASILLTAKSLSSTVTLYSNRDANGACQIMYFTIQ